MSARCLLDVYLYSMYNMLCDVCQMPARCLFAFLGLLNSVRTAFPCYMCLAPRDELYNFATRFPLRHNDLVDHHVSEMRKLVRTRGITAMLDYSKAMSRRRLLDVAGKVCVQGRSALWPWWMSSSEDSSTSTLTLAHQSILCIIWSPDV